MTLKKSKTGQAIFEYFILTIVVVAVVLFFSNSDHFKRIKNSLTNDNNNGAIDNAVNEILKGPSD